MRYKEFKLNEAELLEAKMSPARLKAAAEELGAVAGMEFEMIVPDVSLRDEPSGNRFMSSSGRSSSRQRREPEYIEPEIDYDANEPFPFRNDWANRISYFFTHGQEPNSPATVKRAIDKFKQNYMEWEEDRLNSYIDFHQNEFTKLLVQNLENDPAFPTEEDRLAYANRLWDEEGIRGEEWKLAVDKMKEQFRNPVNFRSFLDSIEMRSMRDFGERYDLDWPYYIEQENFDDEEESYNDTPMSYTVESFTSALGRDANYSRDYHGAKREDGKYSIEGDGSLEPMDSDDAGIEFISPTLPLNEILGDLDKVVKWAKREGCYTGPEQETGLHINVSIPSIDTREELDYVKLVLFLGDHYILNEFDRYGNDYCQSSLDLIYLRAQENPNLVVNAIEKMQQNLNGIASRVFHSGVTSKKVSVNNKGNYIEFRGPGGDWLGAYTNDENSIPNTLYRMIWAINVASKPDLYRKEYYTKLSDLLGRKEVTYYDPKDPRNAKQPTTFSPVRNKPGLIPHVVAGNKENIIEKLRETVVDFIANGGRYPQQEREKIIKKTLKIFGGDKRTTSKPPNIPGAKPPQQGGADWQSQRRTTSQPEYVAPGLQTNPSYSLPPQIKSWMERIPTTDTETLEKVLGDIRNNRGDYARRLWTTFTPEITQIVIQALVDELNRRNQEAGDVPEEQ